MPTATPTMPPSAIGVSNTRDSAVLRLQSLGEPEDAAEEADILAEHDDAGSRASITSIAEFGAPAPSSSCAHRGHRLPVLALAAQVPGISL